MKKILSILASALLISIMVTSEITPLPKTFNNSHHEVYPLDLPDQH